MKLFSIFWLLTFTGVFSQNASTSFFNGSCPPDGFDSLNEFDIGNFISARWYSIQQKETWYQPASELYCVYAEYALDDSCPFCFGRPTVSAYHSARSGGITGSERNITLKALVPFPERHPARACVSREYFPLVLVPNANLWIIDAGTYIDVVNNNPSYSGTPYEWAIITTGPPSREGANGTCYTRGMWMITRDPDPLQEAIDAIRERAFDLGLDVSQWLSVVQSGCVYG